ncbi:hypothetical protein PKOR_04870 [Pontibacter korlensis]|uniref:Uncharacterized protein n=1 Tax=Pontibacter korlensis TaxID=400092 RepID=A0A0E3UVJ2_9BACT|nr:hypothetical protein [Pontibacter korlensis]AKD02577.1 hypothetical protein PKOR_04870 [Pontibacter korlensis]
MHKSQLDNIILFTENYCYPFNRIQAFDPYKPDSVRLITTRLFRIVRTGYVKANNVEQELKQKAGIFDTLMFVPIAFALVSLFGVAMRNNKEQLLNAAVMNVLLSLILLWIMGYF